MILEGMLQRELFCSLEVKTGREKFVKRRSEHGEEKNDNPDGPGDRLTLSGFSLIGLYRFEAFYQFLRGGRPFIYILLGRNAYWAG